MRLGKKDVLFVEYFSQLKIQDAFAVKLFFVRNQEAGKRTSYFFVALTRDTTSLSLNW